jgi:hypothetical protein
MRLGRTGQWKRGNFHVDCAAGCEAEQFRQFFPEHFGSQQRSDGEAHDRLVLENEPEKLGNTEPKILDVQRAIDHQPTRRRHQCQADRRDGSANRFVDDLWSRSVEADPDLRISTFASVIDTEIGSS